MITTAHIIEAVRQQCDEYSAEHAWTIERLALADLNDEDIPWQLQDAAHALRVTKIAMPPPTGRRLHPKCSHIGGGPGPDCFDLGCPEWCWSGHSMSYGDDTPDALRGSAT